MQKANEQANEPSQIYLLGRAKSTQTIPPLPSKAFPLFALLATVEDKSRERREVAALLWNSENDADSLMNLRQLLARLKVVQKTIGDIIVVNKKTLRLCCNTKEIDLLEFIKCSSSNSSLAETLRAIKLFRGDLLWGIEEPTVNFSQWLLVERGALRERFFACCERVT